MDDHALGMAVYLHLDEHEGVGVAFGVLLAEDVGEFLVEKFGRAKVDVRREFGQEQFKELGQEQLQGLFVA